jgi:hypothetical protein
MDPNPGVDESDACVQNSIQKLDSTETGTDHRLHSFQDALPPQAQ